MKGTFFQKPFEFKLEVQGESWRQGDMVAGTLTVKNHGPEAVPLKMFQAALAYGSMRKVRGKSSDPFDIIASAPIENDGMLEPQKDFTHSWSFQTDRNCPITDSTGSLFMVYGQGDATDKLGHLQLIVHPYSLIQQFLDTFLTGFRFSVKGQKFRKGWVEVKLAPPEGSKAFTSLDFLLASFHFDGEKLEVQYEFNVKKVEATAASFGAKKGKLETQQTLEPSQYLLPSGRVNPDALESAIREALSTVESKVIF